MPTFRYFCKWCEEAYQLKMSIEELESRISYCPKCGEEGKQELYAVSPDDESAWSGYCGSDNRGCH